MPQVLNDPLYTGVGGLLARGPFTKPQYNSHFIRSQYGTTFPGSINKWKSVIIYIYMFIYLSQMDKERRWEGGSESVYMHANP